MVRLYNLCLQFCVCICESVCDCMLATDRHLHVPPLILPPFFLFRSYLPFFPSFFLPLSLSSPLSSSFLLLGEWGSAPQRDHIRCRHSRLQEQVRTLCVYALCCVFMCGRGCVCEYKWEGELVYSVVADVLNAISHHTLPLSNVIQTLLRYSSFTSPYVLCAICVCTVCCNNDINTNRPQTVIALLERMKNENVVPNTIVLTAAIDSLAREGGGTHTGTEENSTVQSCILLCYDDVSMTNWLLAFLSVLIYSFPLIFSSSALFPS